MANIGDDMVAVSVCPHDNDNSNNDSYQLLYITVDCWQLGANLTEFSLFLSSNQNDDIWRYEPLTNLPTFGAIYELQSSSRFVVKNQQGEEVGYFGCR